MSADVQPSKDRGGWVLAAVAVAALLWAVAADAAADRSEPCPRGAACADVQADPYGQP